LNNEEKTKIEIEIELTLENLKLKPQWRKSETEPRWRKSETEAAVAASFVLRSETARLSFIVVQREREKEVHLGFVKMEGTIYILAEKTEEN
jgi:hypothetical protein